jgi:phospholipid/cholesterol/gamma-HCH transport system ATP-binding protein
MIEASGICKGFNGRTILSNLNLSVSPGEIVVVLGESGSGKSVLFRLLLGLETPDEGEICYNSTPWNEFTANERQETMRNFGAIFQGGQLFADKTIYENLQAALDATEDRSVCHKRIQTLLSDCQFDFQNVNQYPETLSGGERLRAAIAKAIINDPVLLIADEPTAGLDPRTAEIIATQLRASHCAKKERISIVMTHDLRCAAIVADRILFLDSQLKNLVSIMDSEEIEGYRAKGGKGVDLLENAILKAIPTSPHKDKRIAPRFSGKNTYLEDFLRKLRTWGEILVAVRNLRSHCNIMDFRQRFYDFFIRSLPLVSFVGIVIGAAFILSLFAALEIFGAELEAPRILSLAIVREIGPLVAGLLLSGRLGANIAAEMGLRKTQNVFDMLKVMGRDPNEEFFSPMFLAAMIGLPLLFLIMDGCAIYGGFILFHLITSNSMQSYMGTLLESLAPQDFLFTILKGCLFGYLILATSYHLGSSVQQPQRTIERQVGKAVVGASVAIITVNFIIMRVYDQLF